VLLKKKKIMQSYEKRGQIPDSLEGSEGLIAT